MNKYCKPKKSNKKKRKNKEKTQEIYDIDDKEFERI